MQLFQNLIRKYLCEVLWRDTRKIERLCRLQQEERSKTGPQSRSPPFSGHLDLRVVMIVPAHSLCMPRKGWGKRSGNQFLQAQKPLWGFRMNWLFAHFLDFGNHLAGMLGSEDVPKTQCSIFKVENRIFGPSSRQRERETPCTAIHYISKSRQGSHRLSAFRALERWLTLRHWLAKKTHPTDNMGSHAGV